MAKTRACKSSRGSNKKSVLSLISDDSDEETVEVRLKDNKIVDSLKENDLKEEQL